jgi:hypothetical protein
LFVKYLFLKNSTLTEAYRSIEVDKKKIRNYLLSKGISAADIIFSAITIIKNFETSYNANGRVRYNLFTGFTLNQNGSIQSKAVSKTEDLSRKSNESIRELGFTRINLDIYTLNL